MLDRMAASEAERLGRPLTDKEPNSLRRIISALIPLPHTFSHSQPLPFHYIREAKTTQKQGKGSHLALLFSYISLRELPEYTLQVVLN